MHCIPYIQNIDYITLDTFVFFQSSSTYLSSSSLRHTLSVLPRCLSLRYLCFAELVKHKATFVIMAAEVDVSRFKTVVTHSKGDTDLITTSSSLFSALLSLKMDMVLWSKKLKPLNIHLWSLPTTLFQPYAVSSLFRV